MIVDGARQMLKLKLVCFMIDNVTLVLIAWRIGNVWVERGLSKGVPLCQLIPKFYIPSYLVNERFEVMVWRVNNPMLSKG